MQKENDIFLGWEKGSGKKWGKSKKKGGTDLSLEEMKKQAAVQCLRSASDEVSPTTTPPQLFLLYKILVNLSHFGFRDMQMSHHSPIEAGAVAPSYINL